MSKLANKLVCEDQLCELPPATHVQLVLKDKNNTVLAIYRNTVWDLMLRRGGNSKRRDQLREPLRREVRQVLMESGSVVVEAQ